MLARLLKLYTEINTEEGLLISEDELEVGAEAFQVDEDGNLIPAADGEYHSDEAIYTVVSGVVTSITKKEIENEPVVEEVEEEKKEEEIEMAEEKKEEEEVVEEEVEEDDKQAEIDALKAENEELKAQIEELKAQIEELNKQLEEPVAESVDVKEKKFTAQRSEDRINNVYNIVKNIKKNK